MEPGDHHSGPKVRLHALPCLLVAACILLPMGNASAADDAPPPAQLPTGALELTVADAVLMALGNNVAFHVERLRPDVQRAGEDIEQAAFDPTLYGSLYYQDATGATGGGAVDAEVGVSRFFPTGTTAQAAVGATSHSADGGGAEAGSWDMEVTQALLRGRGQAVNLVGLQQARIDTRISQHELRAVAEALVATVETTYWDCVLAREKISIYAKSLEVAEQQIGEVRERIAIGKVAEIELAAAEAELAEKREGLIAARGDLAKKLLSFRYLINQENGQRNRELRFLDSPRASDMRLAEVAAHVKLGIAGRSDLKQARLQVEKGELEIVRTRNGLLPQLDFFARLGGTHYSGALSGNDDNEYEVTAGLVMTLPVGRREEKARHRQAELTLEMTELALTNMEQLIQLDVGTAYVEAGTAREQIAATGATRKLRQDTLTAEREKFRVGTSTTLQVAQAWRDLLASQINEIQAVVTYQKALIDLYRLEGTLLERRGIRAPTAGGE